MFDLTEVQDLSSRAREINCILEKVYTLSQDKALSKLLSFSITKKQSEHEKRYLRYKNYHGPDDNTIEILHRCSGRWLEKLSEFWRLQASPSATPSDLFEETVCDCLNIKQNDAHSTIIRRYLCVCLSFLHQQDPSRKVETVAEAISKKGYYATFSISQLTIVTKQAIDAGYRYRNIENALGAGSLFRLGLFLPPALYDITLSVPCSVFGEEHLLIRTVAGKIRFQSEGQSSMTA